jgi:hypothetical protein
VRVQFNVKHWYVDIEPIGDRFRLVFRQQGIEDVVTFGSLSELTGFAKTLGSQWLAPEDQKFLIRLGEDSICVTRALPEGPFTIEHAGRPQSAPTVDELIARFKEMLPDRWLAQIDRPMTFEIQVE